MTAVVPEQKTLSEELCFLPRVPQDVPNTSRSLHDQAEACFRVMTPEYELSAGTGVHLVDTPDALQRLYSAASCASERGGSCGVDAEWPPSTSSASGTKPVATLLQLAFSWDDTTEVFLVDLMNLGPNHAQELLWAVFADRGILKVGHSLKGDFAAIGRAAASSSSASRSNGKDDDDDASQRHGQQQRPGAPSAAPVFDLSSNWHAFFGLSLANIAKAALGRTLDKTEQCSAWGCRPLTHSQRTYAAKDAAVCVSIFRELCSSAGISRDLTAAEAASELQDLTRAAVLASKASKGVSENQRRVRGRRDKDLGEPEADTSSLGESFCYSGPPVPWPSGTPASAMRFVCDVSLEGLARMLRLCGVNAASPRRTCPQYKDVQQWILEICCKREAPRVILTADRGLLRKVGGYPAYLVRSKGKQRQMREVTEAFGMVVDEGDIMSRCSKCNGEFLLLGPGEAEGRVDDEVYLNYPERDYWACDSCGQVFWQGGQYHRGLEFVQQLVESLTVNSSSSDKGLC